MRVRQRFELPVVETTETFDGVTYTVRMPDLFGVAADWGQVSESGSTMLISAELDEAEVARIPARYRRERIG